MLRSLIKILPVGWAVHQTLKKGYGFKDFRSDFSAALVVSLISLPLSMALAIAIGMPPQHGIYTAIVAGIAAALFGGSLYQVSGPTAAFVVILIPIFSEFGLRGLIWCQILAGVMLIVFGIAKLGKWIHMIPMPVTIGFTAGIAVTLVTISCKDFFGLPIEQGTHFIEKITNLITHFSEWDFPETLIGVVTLFTIFGSKRTIKCLPAPIIGIVMGILLGWCLSLMGYSIALIGTEFKFTAHDGSLHTGIPPYAPTFQIPTFQQGSLLTFPSLAELKDFLFPAFVIALLAALESLLSAMIADNLTNTRHHPNAELNGIGIANILSGLVSGIPATAAIARTATNIHSGAKSPMAAILHALLIFSYVMIFAPLICAIPMSALAALLIFTAINMSHSHEFADILRQAPIIDRLVLMTCFILTVFVDMVVGITTGVILAKLMHFAQKRFSLLNH